LTQTISHSSASTKRTISSGAGTLPRTEVESCYHWSWACRHVNCGRTLGSRTWGFAPFLWLFLTWWPAHIMYWNWMLLWFIQWSYLLKQT